MRFVSKTKECFAYNTKIIETPTTKEVYIYENPIFIHSKEKADLTDTSNRKKFDEMSAHKQYDSLKRKQKHYEQARWDIARIVDCNFDNKTKFVTLTFKENIQEILITNREFKYFIQRLNYYLYHTKTQLLKYLATWEKQKRGAIHYHVIFFDFLYIAKEKLQNLWSHGFIKINRIDVDSKENRGRYLSKYFGKDLDLKEHKKKAFFKSQNLKVPHETKVMLTEDILHEWLLYKRDYTSVKAKTIQEYVSEWNRFFKDTELVKMKIGEIKPITLIRFFREATKDRQFTHKRVSNARSVLNGIMSYAIEEEIISHNPVSDVNFKQFTYKPVEVQSDNVFSRDDTHKLLNYLRCIIEPYSLAIQLSFYLFIRVGETKAIRWEDIDYNNRLVYLHRQATCERTLNDDLTFSSRKVKVVNQMKGNTSHGFRKQFLTDEALKILHKAKELNPNGIYVFEPNGEIMTTDSFNRRLKKYCKEAGVPYHSSHKIRFYNASTAFDGNNLTTLSYLMGHSETATTLHYLRNVNKRKNDRLAFQNLGISS